MEIEFVSKKNVTNKLSESLKKAVVLRGAVAFWSIDFSFFKQNLVNALNHSESFYCIDICSPTDFDAISSIEIKLEQDKKGNTFFVHLKRKSEHENLLHSKVILMDLPNGEVELWVGSHNSTRFALTGFNIESSMILKFKKGEYPIYNEVIKFLNEVRNENHNNFFSDDRYFYFKALQDAANRKWVEEYLRSEEKLNFDNIFFCRTIKILGEELSSLENKTIIVIGESLKEFQEIEKYGKNIFIHAIEKRNSQAYLYEAKLTARDILDDNYSKDVEFGKRRIGIQDQDIVHLSLNEEFISKVILGKTGFYINIEIKRKIAPDKVIKIYTWEDYSELWEDKSNYSEAISFEHFQQQYMPKFIEEISLFKKSKSIIVPLDQFYYDDSDSMAIGMRQFCFIFKRKIFLIMNS